MIHSSSWCGAKLEHCMLQYLLLQAEIDGLRAGGRLLSTVALLS